MEEVKDKIDELITYFENNIDKFGLGEPGRRGKYTIRNNPFTYEMYIGGNKFKYVDIWKVLYFDSHNEIKCKCGGGSTGTNTRICNLYPFDCNDKQVERLNHIAKKLRTNFLNKWIS